MISEERSPCYICDFVNEDKNNDRCMNCEKRIDYARRHQLISLEVSYNFEVERENSRMIDIKLGGGMTIEEIDENCGKILQDIKDLETQLPRRVGKKRRGRKPVNPDSEMRSRIYVRFPVRLNYIHQELIAIAETENRTMSMQAIRFIKEGIEKYKGVHNE